MSDDDSSSLPTPDGPSSDEEQDLLVGVPREARDMKRLSKGVKRAVDDLVQDLDDLPEFQAHQPSLPDDLQDQWLPTDAERAIAAEPIRSLPKPDRTGFVTAQEMLDRKVQFSPALITQLFDEHGVPVRQQISILRSLGSFLSAVCPPPPKKGRTKK